MGGLAGHLQIWAQGIYGKYGVNPWAFLCLMVVCAPLFYYSIYRLGRAAVKKDFGQLNRWSIVFLMATVLPYLYVLAFGRNLPWYLYLVLAALILQGLWSYYRRRKISAEKRRGDKLF